MERVLEFAKEQYGWEAQRRDKLNSSSSIPVGFATLGGTMITSISSKIQHPWSTTDIILLSFIALTIVFGILFIYHTVRFYRGPVYKYVAECDKIVEFSHNNKVHFGAYPELGKADEIFDEFLIKTYSYCATINCKNNDDKSHRLYLMNQWVLTMLAPCLFAGLVLGVSQLITLDQYDGVNAMAEDDKRQNPPPPPPSAPPERSVKDGANTTIPKQK